MNIERRAWLKTVLAATATLVLMPNLSQFSFAQPAPPASASVPRPNIVYILIDDLGWRDLACYGSHFYQTPNIDKLATQGMRFTTAYAPAPNCAPSRASLLTGMYTPRHGIFTVGTSERGDARQRKLIPTANKTVLQRKFITIAEALKPAGYVCASIGKWHLGAGDTGPLGQGFDVNVGGNKAGLPKSYFSPYHNKDLPDGPPGEYLTDRLTTEAEKFIRDHKDHPFFLYLPHYAVHSPHEAKADLEQKYKTKPPDGNQKSPVYAAMIESVDQSVARIMKLLDDLKLADNTIVVFTSDNGGVETITDMRPLREGKGWPYEGGIRVPLIVRWPDHIAPNSTCPTPVNAIDFFPTLLDILKLPKPDQPVDGQSLLPLLTQNGTFNDQRPLFWHLPMYLEAMTSAYTWRCTPCSIIRHGDWKLIEFFEDNHLELYNLKNDPSESHDLASAEPQKAEELLTELKAWQKQTKAAIPEQLNPKFNPAVKVKKLPPPMSEP